MESGSSEHDALMSDEPIIVDKFIDYQKFLIFHHY